jgi:hypothetical protein
LGNNQRAWKRGTIDKSRLKSSLQVQCRDVVDVHRDKPIATDECAVNSPSGRGRNTIEEKIETSTRTAAKARNTQMRLIDARLRKNETGTG